MNILSLKHKYSLWESDSKLYTSPIRGVRLPYPKKAILLILI